MYLEALAMQKELPAVDQADVAKSLVSLALVLVQKGDLAGAEALFREALAMQMKLLGTDHLDVAASLNNLAIILAGQGIVAPEKIESYYAQNLDKFKVEDEVKLRMIFLANK